MVRLDLQGKHMNLDLYKNDGWGLSKKEFDLIYEELLKVSSDVKEYNIVEFGSGGSTKFFVNFAHSHYAPLKIYSFDDSQEYAYKGVNKHLDLKIVPLVDTSDIVFEEMFKEKKYDPSKMKDKVTAVHTRQKNTFYKIDDSMLPLTIDMLVVDGPHGNGRSLAYLHCFDKLKVGSLVLIDDASHYPFYDHLKMLANTEVIYEQHIRENKWDLGGDFILCKIVN